MNGLGLVATGNDVIQESQVQRSVPIEVADQGQCPVANACLRGQVQGRHGEGSIAVSLEENLVYIRGSGPGIFVDHVQYEVGVAVFVEVSPPGPGRSRTGPNIAPRR